jgi:hypothetical protein
MLSAPGERLRWLPVMGKASSAKKVARAARAGGVKRSNRPRLTFPLAVVAVIVLGAGTAAYARQQHESLVNSDVRPILNSDHWHAAYGFYVCDKFLPAYKDLDGKTDVMGIHSHADQTGTAGDGIIHEHPFKATAAGEHAQLSVWAPMVGIKFFNDGWQLPDGTEYRNGSAKCGDAPAKVAVYRWKSDVRLPVEVFEKDFGSIYLNGDRDAYTFAVLPEGAPVPPPKPPSVVGLDSLSDTGASSAAGGAGGAGGAGDLSGLQGQVPTDGGTPTVPASP